MLVDILKLWLEAPTASSTTFTRPATTTTTWTPAPGYTLPAAPGTLAGCVQYRDYNNNNSVLTEWGLDATVMNSLGIDFNACSSIAGYYHVTVDDLVEWNPSLNATDCSLQPGYSYCVLPSWDYASDSLSPDTVSSYCANVDPTWIMEGTTPDCTCYTYYLGNDEGGCECDGFVDARGKLIPVADLLAMNPWIGGTGDCDAGLFANMADLYTYRAIYCIDAFYHNHIRIRFGDY
ncbi:hypothetical protein BJY00DRAFT_314841 [Aspergillus carlsbadensis]|nr:hypothetical protein BJY00DRAFT_314841 [Aspergillus carlsbadensis]